jgi:hypothetical protein
MAKKHGVRQQKKVAKQKAKRSQKRSSLLQRGSNDPSIRLQGVEKSPVVHAFVGVNLWTSGMGSAVIARQESAERLVFAVFLIDVHCLGVKDAFWRVDTPGKFTETLRKIQDNQPMRVVSPECLAKIVKGAVEYAQSFGFAPHPDYRHATRLLEGIDPATCREEFTFGRDGKPFFVQGPYESPEQAGAILQRIKQAGGNYLVREFDPDLAELAHAKSEWDEIDVSDEDELPDDSF